MKNKVQTVWQVLPFPAFAGVRHKRSKETHLVLPCIWQSFYNCTYTGSRRKIHSHGWKHHSTKMCLKIIIIIPNQVTQAFRLLLSRS